MPMVYETWSGKGLRSWQVSELDPKSGYTVQCLLQWESAEAFGKAASEDDEKIMGDIPNYTEGKPTIIVGKVVGSS